LLSIHKPFPSKRSIEVKGGLIHLDTPKVMGIINFTPDSFYDGGHLKSDRDILEIAEKHLSEGATFLDVGCYSSRPDANDITLEEEKSRLARSLSVISKEFPEAIISVDTFRAAVAKEGLDAGATMVNDISGGELDPEMFNLIAERNVPYIMMHMRGTPQTMKAMNSYEDLLGAICNYFAAKLRLLHSIGVKDIIIDPGFGFAKNASQGFELLRKLSFLQSFGVPVLAGLSRKSMIFKTLEINVSEALNGTTALHMIALQGGVSILRVHDTKQAIEAIELYGRVYV